MRPRKTRRREDTLIIPRLRVVTTDVVQEVRGSLIGMLTLVAVLSLWILIGYVQWMNEPEPEGVLPRRVAAAVAAGAEPEIPRPAVRAERAIVVVVDGLRVDFARGMRSLNRLAELGVDLTVDVGLPSMSRAVYTVLGSGAAQDRNGVRTNSFDGRAPVDSLWDRARDAGLRVAAVSNLDWWRALFPSGFDRYAVTTFDGFWETAELALEGDYRLVLLHPTHVDFAGHQRGGVSSAYAEAVRDVDDHLERLLSTAVDLQRDIVFVLSDHGHRDKGGHGGGETEVRWVRAVAAGPGVARRARAEVPATRLAGTMAVLMALPFPWDVEGAPVLEAIDVDTLGPAYVAARQAAWERQTTDYLARLAVRGPARFRQGDGFAGWRRGMDEARQQGRTTRLGAAVGAILVGLFLLLHLRHEGAARLLLAGFSFVAVYVVAAWLTQNAVSLSAAEREYRYLLRVMSIAVLAFISQHALMHFLRVSDWGTAYLLGAWFSGFSVVLVLAYYGIPLTAPLPSAALTFWPIFATLMTLAQSVLGAANLILLWLLERRRLSRFRAGLNAGQGGF